MCRFVLSLEGKAGRIDMVPKEAPLQDVLELLCKELETLARHRLNATWQQEQYRQLTTNLPVGTAVLTLDFAENFKCEHQDEPQSAYFGYQQVVLHPVVMHYRCPECAHIVVDSAVYISDDLGHTPHLVDVITQECARSIQAKTPITSLKIFSDGCSSQYKSKTPFAYLKQLPRNLNMEVERAYFGARHGKNLCDALGGTVKNCAKRAVLSRRVLIRDPQTFYG